MSDAIAPGTQVVVKIKMQPTNEAARKTLVRVLNKDAANAEHVKRQRRARDRHNRDTNRGGRIWVARIPKKQHVRCLPGEQGTVLATVDVLRDLASVSRFVDVTPA
ncbi:hypothetical protein [Mucisphaera sp.]|uniref:hypothetical protein n=1 Tax=Mucisphaera sp. TaxID=2913024 RepID=UPI003D1396A1